MSVNGRINGWVVSPTVAKWVIGTIVSGAMWVATIQADVNDKAEKIDVATQVATQTEVLKSINKSLTIMAASYKNLDNRQRDTEITQARQEAEIAALKAK